MARLVFSIMGMMLFGALLGVHGMLTEDMEVDGPYPYPYSYVEERDGDHQSVSALPNAYAHQGLTDSNKMLQFEIRRDVTTTPTPYVGSHQSGLPFPALGRVKRTAHWYPYYLHWLPHPTRESHYVYDSYLGKVKREAPTPYSYNTKFSSHE